MGYLMWMERYTSHSKNIANREKITPRFTCKTSELREKNHLRENIYYMKMECILFTIEVINFLWRERPYMDFNWQHYVDLFALYHCGILIIIALGLLAL